MSLTIGVEEEFVLVHPDNGTPVPAGPGILARAARGGPPAEGATGIQRELLTSMVETSTGICADLADVRKDLTAARARLADIAGAEGARPLASGTPTTAAPPRSPSPTPHYQHMRHLYEGLVTETETCGCHVHIAIPDRPTAVAVLNHLRPWLPTLLALSANSPFHQGVDTGYASWRTMSLSRWPTTRIPPYFSSAAHYDETVAALHTGGVLPPGANAYWLARPSDHLPTVEVRVADVTATVDEAVLQAGLTRALVRTSLDALADGRAAPRTADHMAHAALWTAARYGIDGPALHPHTGRQVAAGDLARELLTLVRPALKESGDWEEIDELLRWVLSNGNGADRRRRGSA
ncbi:carboxylate-amine ligase [Streptomyces sp. SP18CS02]|uniref:carboxylate-amine ligase n=1 Tax=Streptomyces sp. SP18CS02 TaxID=3002531 RepID=UPI002E7A053A|nr:glutamate--cysteine ligase [Streptomyces sp. SP18CS02]MEE1751548.1 glutamate--cysteine ligase [Streptomyces sp. SP18CS02]